MGLISVPPLVKIHRLISSVSREIWTSHTEASAADTPQYLRRYNTTTCSWDVCAWRIHKTVAWLLSVGQRLVAKGGKAGAARHFLVHQKPVFTTSSSRARTHMPRMVNDHRLSPLKLNSLASQRAAMLRYSSAKSVALKQSCPSRVHALHSPLHRAPPCRPLCSTSAARVLTSVGSSA